MNKVKIFLALLILLILCSCEEVESESNGSIYNYSINKYYEEFNVYTYTDSSTCVEYLIYERREARAGMGGLSVRYNSDGTIKINNKCLKEKDTND